MGSSAMNGKSLLQAFQNFPHNRLYAASARFSEMPRASAVPDLISFNASITACEKGLLLMGLGFRVKGLGFRVHHDLAGSKV